MILTCLQPRPRCTDPARSRILKPALAACAHRADRLRTRLLKHRCRCWYSVVARSKSQPERLQVQVDQALHPTVRDALRSVSFHCDKTSLELLWADQLMINMVRLSTVYGVHRIASSLHLTLKNGQKYFLYNFLAV